MDNQKPTLRIIIEVLLGAVLLYAPLAFGSVAPVYHPPIWLASTLLFIINAYYLARFGRRNPVGRKKYKYASPILPLWCFACFLIWNLFFLLPLPAVVAKLFGAVFVHAEKGFASLHPNVEMGLRGFFDWFSVFALFFVAATFPDSRSQVRRIVYVILAAAGFEAIYGMVEFASGHQHIFNYAKSAYLDSATGTFINRNHFANFLSMAICLNIGVVTYHWAKSSKSYSRSKVPFEMVLLLAFFSIILSAGLLFSRSRAGLVCLMAALVAIGYFYAKPVRRNYFILLLIIGILVVFFSIWMGMNPLPDRFLDLSKEVQAEDSRLDVWAQSLIIWGKAPLTGYGTSSFADVFRVEGERKILARYLHAHNDYLEILVENGLVGFILLFGGICLTMYLTIVGLLRRNSRFARYYSQGMLGAILVFLLHGLLDFNLYIFANRITFFTILGLAYLTAFRRMTR